MDTSVGEPVDAQGRIAQAGEILAGLTVALRLLRVAGVHQGSAHIMLAEFPGIGKDVVNDIGQGAGIADATARLVQVLVEGLGGISRFPFRHIHEVGLMRETGGMGNPLVVVAGQPVGKTPHPGDVDIQGAAQGGVGGAVHNVTAIVNVPERVLRVGFLAVHIFTHGDTVGEGGSTPRGDSDRRVVRADAVVLGLRIVEIEAQLDVLGDGRVDAASKGLAHELVPLNEVLVVIEGGSEKVVHAVGSAGHVQGVVLLNTGLGNIFHPVGPFALVVLCLLDRAEPVDCAGGETVTRVIEFDVAVTVSKFRNVVLLHQCHGTPEGDHRFADHTLLGGNHDGAVRSLGTVRCQGGSILHHAHGLNGIWGDIVQITLENHAV